VVQDRVTTTTTTTIEGQAHLSQAAPPFPFLSCQYTAMKGIENKVPSVPKYLILNARLFW